MKITNTEELNHAVAEHIMGWFAAWECDDIGGMIVLECMKRDPQYWTSWFDETGTSKIHYEAWNPAKDMNQAIQVLKASKVTDVEDIGEEGWAVGGSAQPWYTIHKSLWVAIGLSTLKAADIEFEWTGDKEA
jgi:hypothetical protein